MKIHETEGIVLDKSQPEMAMAQGNATETVSLPVNAITEKDISKAIDTLKKYKDAKKSLEQRVIDNEQWYKMRHWDVVRNKHQQGENAHKDRPEPTSAWLFNSIANKHADAMDNYPEPNVLPREQADEADAQSLTEILPVILERNEFEETYSDAWWYKLKTGTGVYGVFWDSSLENGIGDISIKKLDLLNIFFEAGITDIQKSRNLFIVDLVDTDILEARYPDLKGKLDAKTIDVSEYVYDDTVDTSDKAVVVDWYYKKQVGTKTVLHFVKFVGNNILYASENDGTPNPLTGKTIAEAGWYEHGKYPVVFDVLYPEEGTPCGFGYVDICKDPQMYIDKLNQIVLENTLKVSRKRWFVKDNSSVNINEFADASKDFVSVAGSLNDDNIKEIEYKPLDMNIINLLQYKVDELKETSGNRDVNQGSSSGGVTSGAAISALQESGNKLSRDIIKAAYRCYTQINYLCIELIRQFYDFERTFRIEGVGGAMKYIAYSNANIAPQPVMDESGEMGTRVPVFDVVVKPQRTNPFSRLSQNELAKELYGAGFFNPELADQALIALELMDFEGKEKIVEKITNNQMQYLQKQLMTMAMGAGIPMNAPVPQGVEMDSSIPQEGGIAGAIRNGNTSYQQRLAQQAVPSVE